MKFAFDLDDVLCNLSPQLIAFYNKTFGANIVRDNITNYSLSKQFKISPEDAIERTFQFYKSDYFHSASPVAGAQKAIDQLAKKHDLIVITSRPSFLDEKTHIWIENYFPKKFVKIIHTNQFSKEGSDMTKGDYCREEGVKALVDDALENILDSINDVENLLLMDAPWNRNGELPEKVKRVYNWGEIADFLSKINE